ncbi:MAG: 50S ribosomal protein L11 methyltransferase [Chloroflexi bacterium]|nr:MAG: 50S ribosomal protein L11 methyltransferase [Chloroflexota bacterium]
MYWLEVSVITDGEGAEAVAEALRPFAYNDGVALEQLGDMSSLDPDALETAVTVKIYLPETEDTPEKRQRIEEILYHMGRMYPIPPPTFHKLEEQDWANAWKTHYRPFRIGQRVWIQPSWLDAEAATEEADGIRANDVVLTLDPGMAFGTGLHPTTQMCLQALEELVQSGNTLLDVGTGSGILAIAAVKMGAKPILAFDTDELAVKTTIANAEQNQVDTQIETQQATLDEINEKPWDIVVVNILAPVIISLFDNDDLMSYVAQDGKLVLSGIIEPQMGDVETAVSHAGGKIVKTYQIRDWVSYVVSHA